MDKKRHGSASSKFPGQKNIHKLKPGGSFGKVICGGGHCIVNSKMFNKDKN